MLIQFSLYPQEHNQGSPTMSDKKNANENHHNDPLSKSQSSESSLVCAVYCIV